jgi:hypothetical protein
MRRWKKPMIAPRNRALNLSHPVGLLTMLAR